MKNNKVHFIFKPKSKDKNYPNIEVIVEGGVANNGVTFYTWELLQNFIYQISDNNAIYRVKLTKEQKKIVGDKVYKWRDIEDILMPLEIYNEPRCDWCGSASLECGGIETAVCKAEMERLREKKD